MPDAPSVVYCTSIARGGRLDPPSSLATIRVVLGGEGPETARNRSICWSLGIPQGRRFGGSPRAPQSSLGVPGTREGGPPGGPGVRISVPPSSPGDTSKMEVFGKIPILNPFIYMGTPIYPKYGYSGVPAWGGEYSEVSRIGELLNTVPGVHPRTVPRVPRRDPDPRQHPAIWPIWRLWRSWGYTRSGIPATRSQIWRSEVPGGPVVLVVVTSYQCWWWW